MVDRVNVGGDVSEAQATAQAEHDAKMVEAAERGVTSINFTDSRSGENVKMGIAEEVSEESSAPQRPENIPEKFWNAEKGEVNVDALLKAQQDAEAALRKAQQGETPEEPEAGAEEAGQQNAIDAASAEWAEKGELSESTLANLEKVGLSRDMVNQYIDGQRAIVQTLQNAAFQHFNGQQDEYRKAAQWAADNLSADEIQALDVQLTSTNPAIVAEGAKALAAKYRADADITPAVSINGDGNAASTGSYFKSSAEMQAAINDPRYRNDAAYREEVARKIDRADRNGVNLFR